MLTTTTYTSVKAEQGFTGAVYSCGGMQFQATTSIKQGHILPVARPENLDWTRPGP